MIHAASIPAVCAVLAEVSPEQNWAVITILVGMLIAAVGAIIRGLIVRLNEERATVDELEDSQARERHAAIIRGIDDVKNETRGLKHEVQQLRKDHDELRPRVDRIERTLKPEGAR